MQLDGLSTDILSYKSYKKKTSRNKKTQDVSSASHPQRDLWEAWNQVWKNHSFSVKPPTEAPQQKPPHTHRLGKESECNLSKEG